MLYCHFYLIVFNSLFLIFVSLIFVSGCIPPWLYAAWDSLCFPDLTDYFFFHVNEVGCYLFKYFFRSFISLSSPSGTCCHESRRFNVAPGVSQAVFLFFSILFFIFYLEPVISIILSSSLAYHSSFYI